MLDGARGGTRRLLARACAPNARPTPSCWPSGCATGSRTATRAPIAIETGAANAKHHEVPAALFARVLACTAGTARVVGAWRAQEHARNRRRRSRIASSLEPRGKLFERVFTHAPGGCPFATDGDGD